MSDGPPPLRPSASFKRRSTRPKVDELKVVFDQFDGDKDGLIVLDEFYELMLHLIAQRKFPDVSALTHDESDEIFLDCDRDEDGQLSFAEFKQVFGDDDEDGDEDFSLQGGQDDDDDSD